MTNAFLSVARLERRLTTGNVESLTFKTGVNLLVGPPNTGKTKWLQTLDFLLGDTGANPYEGSDEAGLADKYESAAANLIVDGDAVRIERRWLEPGAKGKIFVGDEVMDTKEFQHWLFAKLDIPLVHFPKGNPMSGQTWPELSFRILLRHIYRQQRFWSGLADQQPEGEQHASLLQFLGLAQRIFTDDYGELVQLKLEVERLKARRDQYQHTLAELARGLLSDEDISVVVNALTVAAAKVRIATETEVLRRQRVELLSRSAGETLDPGQRSRIVELGELRALVSSRLEASSRDRNSAVDRAREVARYESDLADELDRMARAEDAGTMLADLKITHCPACDQTVAPVVIPSPDCFLCHQARPSEPMVEGLGAVRLRFERERLESERKEAAALSDVLARDIRHHASQIADDERQLRIIDNELVPARQAIAAVAQEEISKIDMALGQASERERQLDRVSAALALETDIADRIAALEAKIEPIQERVDEVMRTVDFGAAASDLEDGMNAYLEALNHLRPHTWRHSPVQISLSRREGVFRVGNRRWMAALEGTDSLYFLMAYHYGLLSLSGKPGSHYPGIAIIDLPGEFLGEAIEDKENFIVQPFVDLLSGEAFEGAQLLITGASFTGLAGAHVQALRQVHIA
ncbi:hypothetical protein [Sphingosinicella humi]|uniref:Rad50/SbcC-type AAA domain-containing protein n=1 Tax=Allosphingosinicella humi TaxID=2068657 RepID=A0A2U2J575_9SPHN|nr:hypothetical protein [Sphingosinicella humi]PWG03495.1 hypothetical protein DF286_11900 [Sphingosinicella humi]